MDLQLINQKCSHKPEASSMDLRDKPPAASLARAAQAGGPRLLYHCRPRIPVYGESQGLPPVILQGRVRSSVPHLLSLKSKVKRPQKTEHYYCKECRMWSTWRTESFQRQDPPLSSVTGLQSWPGQAGLCPLSQN